MPLGRISSNYLEVPQKSVQNMNRTAAWLAQLEECWSAERKVTDYNPGRINTQGL